MLLEITKLNIKNEGFKRDISFSDYAGAQPFLEEEGSSLSAEPFCLLRVNNGSHYEDIIVKGTAAMISDRIASNTKKGLING